MMDMMELMELSQPALADCPGECLRLADAASVGVCAAPQPCLLSCSNVTGACLQEDRLSDVRLRRRRWGY